MFEAAELNRIIEAADPTIEAMVLLGINCGFGNTDIAMLPQSVVNLKTRWIVFPRPKTAVERRIPLWTETVAAMTQALAMRPKPKDSGDADLCFITVQGNR